MTSGVETHQEENSRVHRHGRWASASVRPGILTYRQMFWICLNCRFESQRTMIVYVQFLIMAILWVLIFWLKLFILYTQKR